MAPGAGLGIRDYGPGPGPAVSRQTEKSISYSFLDKCKSLKKERFVGCILSISHKIIGIKREK
jgi:hypothetical protein